MTFDPMRAVPAAYIQEILTARAELEAEFAGLTDAELEEPGMTGEWNGRMTLVHIARWDETVAHVIMRDRHGLLPGVNEFEDYEAWNRYWAEVDIDISLWDAKARYQTAHEAVVRTLRHLAPEEWNDHVRGWVREATLNHYRHHAETTRRWRANRPEGS
jgi:hypothetical protein